MLDREPLFEVTPDDNGLYGNPMRCKHGRCRALSTERRSAILNHGLARCSRCGADVRLFWDCERLVVERHIAKDPSYSYKGGKKIVGERIEPNNIDPLF